MAKLTKRIVDDIPIKPERDSFAWDDELPGFGVRVKAGSDIKAFVLQYRVTGRERRATLGRFGILTVEDARKKAKIWLGKVAAGIDPASPGTEDKSKLTVAEAVERYREDLKHRGG